MSRLKTYDIYTEIPNGLFRDIEKEKNNITKNDIEEILIKITDTNNTSDGEVILYSSSEGLRQFNRAMQEAAYIQNIDHESGNMIRDEAEGMTVEQFEAAYPRTNNITRERASNEAIWYEVGNMSEEELIQYFDRISQEEN